MKSISPLFYSNIDPDINSNLDSSQAISLRGQCILASVITSMARLTPQSTARVSASLDLILEGVYKSTLQEKAWNFSLLTCDGFPVEFAFAESDDTIRYVAEVSGPEIDPAERLGIAERKLTLLGEINAQKEISELLHKIQISGPLQYGAWIGGRHGQGGDRFKLYVEVPESNYEEREFLIRDMLGTVDLLPRRKPRFQMIGYEPATSRLEIYFTINGLEFWEVERLLSLAGMRTQWPALRSLIEETHWYRPEFSLTQSMVGFSFAAQKDREEIEFTLFRYARSVFGTDKNIRIRILDLAKLKNWDLKCYEAISLPVAERDMWNTKHGIISFVVKPESKPTLSITLRPPDDWE